MVVYKFQSCSLNSLHPLLSLLCPQVSLNLHLYSSPSNKFINNFFLDFICMCVNIQHLFLSFWLTSLCITSSLLQLTQIHPFLWLSNMWWTGKPGVLQFMGSQWVRDDWVTELNWIVHCIQVPHLLYSSVDGHLGSFRILNIVNSAVVNTGVHVSF